MHWKDQFMWKQGIKFSPNDNPSLTSPEKTNGAPRWCFNITNYLGVLGKGTDVALRMRKGWGAGQGHHTPRLGSDKHGWLGVFTCPQAIKRRRRLRFKSYGSSVEERVRAGALGFNTVICLGYTVALSLITYFCCWQNILLNNSSVHQWKISLLSDMQMCGMKLCDNYFSLL